jgi:hypothetical protein
MILSRLPILVCAVSTIAIGQETSPVASDHFRITDQILQKSPPNFSTNLQIGGFAPWNPDVRINAWNTLFTTGPIQYQQHGQADAGGDDWLQHKSAPRLSQWDSARSGFWDGADVYVYRRENGVMTLLRRTKVARSSIGNDPKTNQPTEEKIWFTDKGPAPASGDFYVLRMQRSAVPMEFRPALLGPDATPVMNGYCKLTGNGTWSYDEKNPAPEGGSQASLKIEMKNASPETPVGPWHWFVAHNDKESKVRFKPGKSYKAQIWLKQEGMSDPRVQLQFGTVMTKIVDVTGEWKKFEFDLPVENPEKPYSSTQNNSTRMWIAGLSNGTLWMDNFLIWQADVEPFAVMPEELEILKDFKPHVLRLWAGLDAPSLDYWLKGGFAQTIRGGYGKTEAPVMAALGQVLKAVQTVGAEPWLILNPWFTAEENANLMEYLAGPPDKGYGKLRAEQGHPEPWTKVFKVIYLESANEAWNQIMRYALPSQPETYAAVADRQFSELKKSPYYSADKFQMVANGWDSQMSREGWTRRVALASKEADRVDVAYYFGGWEKGATEATSEESNSNEIYQDKLFSSALEFGPKIIDSAMMDPDFVQRFTVALAAEPELLAGGLAGLSQGRVNFKSEELEATPGNIAELWAKDSQLTESIKSLISYRRTTLDSPLWHAAYRTMSKTPAIQLIAVQALDLAEPAILGELTEGLIDNNAPSRLVPLLKQHPESVKRWSESPTMSSKDKADLEAFLSKGDKLTYGITNQLNKQLRLAILPLARSGDKAFLDALDQEATEELIRSKMRYQINPSLASTLRESPDRRIEQLMKAMKADPAFASAAIQAINEKPEIFHTEAVALAAAISANIASIHSGEESYKPQDEANILLLAMPPDERKSYLKRLGEAKANSMGELSGESVLLLDAMIAAQLGDKEPARKLADNPLFIRLIEARIGESIPVPFLEAAKNNAAIGDKLADQLALNPGKNAKKLANYEGGPGYSLPGPGKPASEDDENIGKSLALGTATLDVSLQFLSAGSSPIAYYDYKTGDYWASHNNPQERIPYPSWLALKMRNTLCQGDLLKVDPLEVKRIDVPDKKIIKTTNDGKGHESTVKGRKGVALITCHAFCDEKNLSIMLLNRSFSEPRTVSLDIPPGFTGTTKQFVLTNPDPKANNRKAQNVAIQESPGPQLKSGMQVVVPPASVVVIANTK